MTVGIVRSGRGDRETSSELVLESLRLFGCDASEHLCGMLSIPRSTLPLGTDKWGEGRVQLPAHNPLPQMLKLGLSETLGKNVAQLVRGIDFGELYNEGINLISVQIPLGRSF